MLITYEEFVGKLDRKITEGHNFYVQLLQTVIDNPTRYTGIFRVSSAKTKLVQNVTQSIEIKFGDFMEEIVTEYIGKLNFSNLPKYLGNNQDGDSLNTDQLFEDESGNLYLIEQKLRDDHDSTKKRGQYLNFIKKVELLRTIYPNKKLIASMWFIDDGLRKNYRYYSCEMQNNADPNIELNLFYGREMFDELLNASSAWDEIVEYLTMNKLNRANGVLSIPDFDTSDEIFEALKNISLQHKRKLFCDKPQYVQLRKELFPSSFNLNRLKNLDI